MNTELIDWLSKQGYENLRELEDETVVGTTELMFTRAIYIDLTYSGCDKRFCFKDKALALEELSKLKTCDDEPTGYIARRNG